MCISHTIYNYTCSNIEKITLRVLMLVIPSLILCLSRRFHYIEKQNSVKEYHLCFEVLLPIASDNYDEKIYLINLCKYLSCIFKKGAFFRAYKRSHLSARHNMQSTVNSYTIQQLYILQSLVTRQLEYNFPFTKLNEQVSRSASNN